jgi:hypothetical protein
MATDAEKVKMYREKAKDTSVPQEVRNTYLDRANELERKAYEATKGTPPAKLAKGGMPVRGSRTATNKEKRMASGGDVEDDVKNVKSNLYMQKDDDKVYSKVRGLGPGMAAKRLEKRGVDIKGLVGNRANEEDVGNYKKGGMVKKTMMGGGYAMPAKTPMMAKGGAVKAPAASKKPVVAIMIGMAKPAKAPMKKTPAKAMTKKGK